MSNYYFNIIISFFLMNDIFLDYYLTKNVKLDNIIINYLTLFIDCDTFYDNWGLIIRNCKKGRNYRWKKKQQKQHLIKLRKINSLKSSKNITLSFSKRDTYVHDSHDDKHLETDNEDYYDDDMYDCTLHGKNGVEVNEIYTVHDFKPYAYEKDYYKLHDDECRLEMKREQEREWRGEFCF